MFLFARCLFFQKQSVPLYFSVPKNFKPHGLKEESNIKRNKLEILKYVTTSVASLLCDCLEHPQPHWIFSLCINLWYIK